MSPAHKLSIVELGPGSVDDLTLRAWERLASGDPVLVESFDHDVVQTLMARGFPVTIVEGDAAVRADLVVSAAVRSPRTTYGLAEDAEGADETARILKLAGRAGIEVEVVRSIGTPEPLGTVAGGTTLVPEGRRAGARFAELVSIMARLRAPGGCPWDAEQTHESLAIHLLEEAHETLDAIDRGDLGDLREELGDILLQVVFHAEIANEESAFAIDEVVMDLTAKLIARHPHVFGDVKVRGSADVIANWERIKAEGKERASHSEDLPPNLPALLLAHKAQRRISGGGGSFDTSPDRLRAAIERALADPDEETIGALLFDLVALAQRAGVDPEGALRKWSKAKMREGDSSQ